MNLQEVKQELFNRVYTHLLTQKKKSRLEDFCRYRGLEGTKCAVGVLINDKFYEEALEGKNLIADNVLMAVEKSNPEIFTRIKASYVAGFLGILQNIHDFENVESWAEELGELAREENLSIPTL